MTGKVQRKTGTGCTDDRGNVQAKPPHITVESARAGAALRSAKREYRADPILPDAEACKVPREPGNPPPWVLWFRGWSRRWAAGVSAVGRAGSGARVRARRGASVSDTWRAYGTVTGTSGGSGPNGCGRQIEYVASITSRRPGFTEPM